MIRYGQRSEPTEDRWASVWTDDERSRDQNGRSRCDYRKGKPPPSFHFVQPVDKSAEVEKEGEFHRKYGGPAEKLRNKSIRGRVLDLLDEIWWR